MIKFNRYALLLALSVMVYKTEAQEAKSNSFSLQQAIDYAYKNSPNYLNAQNDVLMAKYKRKEVLGMAMPQISTSVDLKNFLEIPTSLIPGEIFGAPPGSFIPVKFGTTFQATGTAQANLLVFSADYLIGLKATKEMIALMNISVTRSKTETVAQVSKAYYSALVNRARIKSLEANMTKLEKTLKDTRELNKQGLAEAIDADRLEVSYNNLVTEKQKTEQLIFLSESVLKFQMGYIGKDTLILTDSLAIDANMNENIDASKIDITKRAEYQLLEKQQQLNNINIKRLKFGYLPTLVAYGSLGYSGMRNDLDFFTRQHNWFPTAIIGGTFSLNIFDGLQRHYKIQQAKVDYKKGEVNMKSLQLAIELDGATAAINYNNAVLSLQVQKRNLELAQNVYNVSQKKYEQGVGSNLEVINAQTSLKEAQTNFFNTVYDMLVYKIDYQKAAGTLIK